MLVKKATIKHNRNIKNLSDFFICGWVDEPTQFTTGSTKMSQIFNGPRQKLIYIEFCKKKSSNPARTCSRPG